MEKPKTVGIAVSKRELAQTIFQECQKGFKKTGIQTVVTEKLEFNALHQNKAFLKSDVIICFGGDGTFLKVCQAVQTKTPVFLVGCGERNILATIEAEDAPQKIEEIVQGRYRIEARNRLQLQHPGFPPALNEILVVPQQSATIMHYELALDNKFQWQDYADGILLATPTGSQAYFSSMHQPVIDPQAAVIGIAPFNSLEKKTSLIVPDSKTIQIQKIFSIGTVEIVLDGQQRLAAPAEINIRLSEKPLWIGMPLATTPSVHLKTSLKPSSRFVLMALAIHGAGTQEDLAKQTSLNSRTIRRALEELVRHRFVSKRPFGKDKRQQLYHPLISKQMQRQYLEEHQPGHSKSRFHPVERLKKRLLI